ncbi:unnamed protein product [Amoebophrya sp. A120]|nr:unnamed protein product [Amoebophrya sp. A120]|eukprot:GSA120T00015354001.1
MAQLWKTQKGIALRKKEQPRTLPERWQLSSTVRRPVARAASCKTVTVRRCAE